MTIGSTHFEHGIFAHASSRVVFNVDQSWGTISGCGGIAVMQECGVKGSASHATFSITAGDRTLWTHTADGDDGTSCFEVDVDPSWRQISFNVDSDGSRNCDTAAWGGLKACSADRCASVTECARCSGDCGWCGGERPRCSSECRSSDGACTTAGSSGSSAGSASTSAGLQLSGPDDACYAQAFGHYARGSDTQNDRPVFSYGRYKLYSAEDDSGTRWYLDNDLANNAVFGYIDSNAALPPTGSWMIWCGTGRKR
jgi:hypothetical protein